MKAFDPLGDAAVHDAAGVGPVGTVLQVVAVQGGVVPALAATGVQEATGVGPVLTVLQLVST